MKLATLTTTVATCAFLATAGAASAADTSPGPVGKGDVPTAHPSASGRPAAVLSTKDCRATWNEAKGDSRTLGADQATPYVANFAMVDKDSNGKINKTEFKKACKNGWVQASGEHERFKRPSILNRDHKPADES